MSEKSEQVFELKREKKKTQNYVGKGIHNFHPNFHTTKRKQPMEYHLSRVDEFLVELFVVVGALQALVDYDETARIPDIFDNLEKYFIENAAERQTVKWARLEHVEKFGLGTEHKPITQEDVKDIIDSFLDTAIFYEEEEDIDINTEGVLERILGQRDYIMLSMRIEQLSDAEFEYVTGPIPEPIISAKG